MKRCLLLVLPLLLATGGTAEAKLRSPKLMSSCAAGFSYGERGLGPWMVEGCHKEVEPKGDETVRWAYKGKVELNGLLVEGSKNLFFTNSPGPTGKNTARILREGGAKLILDPEIGGERQRVVMYDGKVDLSASFRPRPISSLLPDPLAGSAPATIAAERRRGYQATVDLPLELAELFGLRIRDTIEDAVVFADDNGRDASIDFGLDMSFGSAASVLLRDWVGRGSLALVDGTGLTVDKLRFKIPNLEIPGIGGFENIDIRYRGDENVWKGGLEVDFGELFEGAPDFAFSMTVDAATGAPTQIKADLDDLGLPMGPTGIVLQGLRASFDANPLTFGAGATATAGPRILGASVIEMNGDVVIKLEPNFRLEVGGNARMLPTGADTQIARGTAKIIVDSSGFFFVEGDARYEVTFLDVGIGAEIGGSGAYSSTSDRFNMEAFATGKLFLGFLGEVDVVRYAAVVSSNGYGACGNVVPFVQAGVGQRWDEKPKLILGCDLSPFGAVVPGPRAAARAAGSRTFQMPAGVDVGALEITADGPEPDVRVTGPNGVAVESDPPGTRTVAGRVTVIAPAGSSTQYMFIKNPVPGTYTVSWPDDGPSVTNLRLARTADPPGAEVSVAPVAGRPAIRRLAARNISGLAPGESLQLGIRTPAGVMPLGETTGGPLEVDFPERGAGPRQIVATVLRDGIPLPGRSRVVGGYAATVPTAPAGVVARRRGKRVTALAAPGPGAELPDQFQYVLRDAGLPIGLFRAVPGKPARFTAGRRHRRLTVAVRPVVRGRVLPGVPRVVPVKVQAAKKKRKKRRRG